MRKLTTRPLVAALALGMAAASPVALALGLGPMVVSSGLNEPLRAEIPILAADAEELKLLRVRLASQDTFERVGLERPGALAANLSFVVGEDSRGRPVIKISTPNRVPDPFVNLLLEVDWGRGKMVREYTALLDPPRTAPVRVVSTAPVVAPVVASPPLSSASLLDLEPRSEPQTVRTVEPDAIVVEDLPPLDPVPSPVPAPVVRLEAATPPPPAPPPPAARPVASTPAEYGPVSSGETLWAIAKRTRPSADIDMNAMMLAILNANPNAFMNGNINQLRRGAVLRIPGRDDTEVMSRAAAAAEVREQMQSWRDRTQTTAQPAAADSEAPPAVAPREKPPAKPAATARLELVPPGDAKSDAAESGVAAQGNGSEIRADLNRKREEIVALQQKNADLQSRVAELEGLQTDSVRLLEMRNTELAAAQAKMRALEAAEAAAAQAGDGNGTAAAVSVDPMTPPADVADSGQVAAPLDATLTPDEPVPGSLDGVPPMVGDVDIDMPAGAPPVNTADEVLDDVAAGTPDATSQPPAVAAGDLAEDSVDGEDVAFFDPADGAAALQAKPWYRNIWLPIGLGLLLLGGLAYALTRRRARPDDLSRGSASGHLLTEVEGSTPMAAAAATAATMDDDSAQAREDQLLDAVFADPGDLERHLDLVRFYYERGEQDAFEGSAEAMFAQVGDMDDMRWKQVVAMGHELAPDHPLFDSKAGTPPVEFEQDRMVDFSSGSQAEDSAVLGTAAAAAAVADAEDSIDVVDAAADDREWDQMMAPPEPAPSDAPPPGQFEYEFTSEPIRVEALDSIEALPDEEGSGLPSLDFDESKLDADAGDELGFIDFGDEPAELDESVTIDEDAAATKIELARAYIDMGDDEGARAMLEEVRGEGNPGQRDEARRLLESLR